MAEPISTELSSGASAALIERALRGEALNDAQALQLADCADTPLLMTAAAQIRDRGFRNVVTYSRKAVEASRQQRGLA